MKEKVTMRLKSVLLILVIVTSASMAYAATEKTEIFPQLGHSFIVRSVAFSPSGRFALSGSWDQTLRLWDVSTGKEIRSYVGHTGGVNSVAFSPDGKLALSGGDDTLRLWDVATGKEIQSFVEHKTSFVKSVAFSPDGRFVLSGSLDRTLRLWNVAKGKEIRLFSGHAGGVNSVAFSPDGKFALSGSDDKTLRFWNVATGKEIRSFAGHTDVVNSVTFSPDGRYALSGSHDSTHRLWNIKTGKQIRSFAEHETILINSVTFSPDGRFVLSGGYSVANLRLWSVATGKQIRSFGGHTGKVQDQVTSVAFSPDGKFALSGSWDKTLRLWDVATGKEIRSFAGHTFGVNSVAFSSDGRIVLSSGYGDATLRLWDVAIGRGKVICPSAGHTNYITSVAFSPDGRLALSWSIDDNTLRLKDITTGQEIRSFTGHINRFQSVVTFSPNGRFALSGSSDAKKMITASSRTEARSDGDYTLRLWDVATGKEIRSFAGHTGGVSSIAFSPDGSFALSGSWDDTLRLWDVDAGKQIRSFAGHKGGVDSVAFSPDGRFALSGGWDDTLRLWDVATGKEIRSFTEHESSLVQSITFSPDGKFALSGSLNRTLRLWDVATGKEIRSFAGHTDVVNSVAFSPDGRFALSGSSDSTTRLWDINTGREIARFISFTDGEWVIITPEGYFNASANGAKHLNVRVGNNIYGLDQFYSRFYRPELVELALAGKSIEAKDDIGSLAAKSLAPSLKLIVPEKDVSVNEEKIIVKLSVKDNGGGIGDIIVYSNGVQIGNRTRGLVIKAKQIEGEAFSFDVPLSVGKNNIRMVAMNREGSMESAPAEVTVTANIRVARPNLYAVVVGIDEYRNKSIALKYAVSDATEFGDVLKKQATPLFDKVQVIVLSKPAETTRDVIRKILEQVAGEVKPDDVFIFFNASHGLIEQVEGLEQYYLITSNVLLLSSDRITQSALSQTELVNLIGAIPAQKKIIFLDTCHAGKAGKRLQLALLEQRTRGLTESTAIKLLQRAVGSSVFAASLDSEAALEGYKGHGLFTYVLLEGMRGKADIKKDGYITVNNLKDYMEEEIITLSEKVFNRQQTPVIEAGANFPFGKVQ